MFPTVMVCFLVNISDISFQRVCVFVSFAVIKRVLAISP